MEKEPRPIGFTLEIGGQRIRCLPENTLAYLYEDNRFDHLFYVTESDGTIMKGFHIFRFVLGEKFDDVVRYMIAQNYNVESLDEPDDNDKQTFFRKYPNEPLERPKPIQPVELTPSQDNFVKNWGKFLQTIEVTVEDFQ